MDNNAKNKREIYYFYDRNLINECDRIPVVKERASMVHSLIESYELLKYTNVLASTKATPDDLRLFHSQDFVDYMKSTNDIDLEEVSEEQMEYGLCYDCPAIENVFELMLTIAGGSISAAKALLNDKNGVAINWCGGWHHAQRDEAEGFCYVNDIVIAIEVLRQKYKRILYIDLDIHHGNGVENAFAFTKRVFTLSFHKFEAGFYPGTGSANDVGMGNGRGYTCNVPLNEGVSDESLVYLFENICPRIYECYQPEAIVVQCGSDCLNGDPLGQCNITQKSIAHCVTHILQWNKPTLFLGGGGYNLPNTARLWTHLTAVITEQDENISHDIPDHEYFLKYGPDYLLPITKGYQKDRNDQIYMDNLISSIKDNIDKYNVSCL